MIQNLCRIIYMSFFLIQAYFFNRLIISLFFSIFSKWEYRCLEFVVEASDTFYRLKSRLSWIHFSFPESSFSSGGLETESPISRIG